MFRELRPKGVVSSLLGFAAVLALSFVSVTPAQAAANATLGDLSAANPTANKYAGCVAAVLAGSGVTFGGSTAMGATLAAIWPALPAGVANTCKQAVDGKQPQVCVNPIDPATCPAVGTAAAASAADLAAGLNGNWKLVSDGVGSGGYAQTPLATIGPSAPMATVSGTFTTPTSVCTTRDCTVPPAPGLWTDCGPTTCGQVTSLTVSVLGRTPNGENGPIGVIQAVDGFGRPMATALAGNFGQWWSGAGCGAAECYFSSRLGLTCKDPLGAPSGCGGQSITVSFTLDSGAGGSCGCAGAAPPVAQVVEIQLTANNLNFAGNASVCPGLLDCMRYDDPRLSYLDAGARPTVVLNSTTPPSAVINLSATDLACLVGARNGSGLSCLDVTGAFAPLNQLAHAPVVPVPPPTVAAVAAPSGAAAGWERSAVTVTVTASDGTGPGIKAISYQATGAEPMPVTAVPGASAQVTVNTDGATTITTWATDMVGTPSTVQSVTVRLDHLGPVISCATPSAAWSTGDITVACTASDATSGLATPSQASFLMSTSVPAGTESASAATNSVTVCDVAGNCATAGPITGLRVDRLAPSISITGPVGNYTVGQVVNAAYSCSDGGSGVATCTGTVPAGTRIDTAAAGPHVFTVDATDAAGNHSKLAAAYTVTAAPTPAPKPVCTESESGNQTGDHQSECEKHGVAVRPVKEPKSAPTPKPVPTHRPSTHSDDASGEQQEH